MTDFHVVSANLIEKDEEYLLVQEGKEAVRGEWNLPAGGVGPEEDIKEAAIREAEEETGLKVSLEGLLGVFVDESDRSDATVLVFVFSSTPKDFSVEVPKGDEILDAGFFSRNELENMEIRIPFLEEVIDRFEKDNLKSLDTLQDYRQ